MYSTSTEVLISIFLSSKFSRNFDMNKRKELSFNVLICTSFITGPLEKLDNVNLF